MKYKDKQIVYEVGDWVHLTCGGGTEYLFPISYIKDYEYGCGGGYYDYEYKKWVDTGGHFSAIIGGRIFRPATQEEIDKVTKEEELRVGEHIVKFSPEKGGMWRDDMIKVGCQEVSKDLFLKIGKKAGWL